MAAREWVISAGSRGSSRHRARRSATPSRPSTSRSTSTPASDDNVPPSKQAFTGRPATGDRPGSGNVRSSMVSVVLPDECGSASATKSYARSGL